MTALPECNELFSVFQENTLLLMNLLLFLSWLSKINYMLCFFGIYYYAWFTGLLFYIHKTFSSILKF